MYAPHCIAFVHWGLPGLGGFEKGKNHIQRSCFCANAGIFPEAAASARLLVRPGVGGPIRDLNGVYGVRVDYCMDYLITPCRTYTSLGITKAGRLCLSLGCLGRSGGWQELAKVLGSWPSWPTRGPRQQASPGLLHAGQNKVLPRQEAGIGSSYVLLFLSSLSLTESARVWRRLLGEEGRGADSPWRRWRDCFFPAKFGRAR